MKENSECHDCKHAIGWALKIRKSQNVLNVVTIHGSKTSKSRHALGEALRREFSERRK